MPHCCKPKPYSLAEVSPAIRAFSSSGTRWRILSRISRDLGNVDSALPDMTRLTRLRARIMLFFVARWLTVAGDDRLPVEINSGRR